MVAQEYADFVGSAGLIVALAVLVFTALTYRRKTDEVYTKRLEDQLKEQGDRHEREFAKVNRRLEQCENARESLARENLSLMRQVLHLENGGA